MTRAVSGGRLKAVKRGRLVPAAGDLLIAASDGLDTLGRDGLRTAIEQGRRKRGNLAEALVRATLDAQNEVQDSVTAIVMEMRAPEA